MTLYEDAIELVGWFSTRKLNRDEILGRRMAKLPKRAFGGLYYIIIPVIGSNRELKLPPYLAVDKYFFAWMKTIPIVKQ